MSSSANPQPPKTHPPKTQPPRTEFLWYLPNTVEPGHRLDTGTVDDGYGTLDYQVDLARQVEDHGWAGALLGTSWGRPDTFTVAASITARTTTFNPLIAIRPGYWRPAHFASSAATLDQLSGGRVRVNIVSGQDNLHQYGRKFTPVEMLKRLTGSDIQVGPYVRYLYTKLRDIYQIDDPR